MTVVPGWVRDRNGAMAPFDLERLSRRLYQSARRLGPADPLLVRELAEGASLFLGQEGSAGRAWAIPDLVDAVARAVRELGQPGLAAAWLEEHGLLGEDTQPIPATGGPLGADLEELETQGWLRLDDSASPLLADALIDLGGLGGAEAVARLVERAQWSRGPFHLVGLECQLMAGQPAIDELLSLLDPLVSTAACLNRELCVHLPSPEHVARAAVESAPLFANRHGFDGMAGLDQIVGWLVGDARRLAVTAHLMDVPGEADLAWRKRLARLPRPDRPVKLEVGSGRCGPVWPRPDQPAVLGRARVCVDFPSGSTIQRREWLVRLGVAAGIRWLETLRRERRERKAEGRWPGVWGLERCPWLLDLRGATAIDAPFLESAARHEAGRSGLVLAVEPVSDALPRWSVDMMLSGLVWPRGGCWLDVVPGVARNPVLFNGE